MGDENSPDLTAVLQQLLAAQARITRRVYKETKSGRLTPDRQAAFNAACAVQTSEITSNIVLTTAKIIELDLATTAAAMATDHDCHEAVAAERAATVAWLTAYKDLAPGISGLVDDIRLGVHRIDPNEPPGEGVNH